MLDDLGRIPRQGLGAARACQPMVGPLRRTSGPREDGDEDSSSSLVPCRVRTTMNVLRISRKLIVAAVCLCRFARLTGLGYRAWVLRRHRRPGAVCLSVVVALCWLLWVSLVSGRRLPWRVPPRP